MTIGKPRILAGYGLSLTLLLPGCLAASLANVGKITVIGAPEMEKVKTVNSPELTADATRLAGKGFRAGTPEYYAALCMRGYINGRSAEISLNKGRNQHQRSPLQGEMIGGYGTCAQHCRVAATQMRSPFSDLAAKYQVHCARGASGAHEQLTLQSLEKRVAQFKEERQALGLFFADKDCRALLAQAQQKHPSAKRLPKLAAEIEALSRRNASAIAKGKAFYEGPRARRNFAQREALDAERQVLATEIDALRRRRAALRRAGSLNAHMEARRLDDQERAKRRLLNVKNAQLGRLKAAYRQMAIAAGVVTG